MVQQRDMSILVMLGKILIRFKPWVKIKSLISFSQYFSPAVTVYILGFERKKHMRRFAKREGFP